MTSINLYLYCYGGAIATENFIKYSNALYEMDWLKLSLKYQKYFVIMIGNMQKEMIFSGHNIVSLNLEIYSKVKIIARTIAFYEKFLVKMLLFCFQILKTVISYYLMFKTLTKWIGIVNESNGHGFNGRKTKNGCAIIIKNKILQSTHFRNGDSGKIAKGEKWFFFCYNLDMILQALTHPHLHTNSK